MVVRTMYLRQIWTVLEPRATCLRCRASILRFEHSLRSAASKILRNEPLSEQNIVQCLMVAPVKDSRLFTSLQQIARCVGYAKPIE